MRKIAYTACLLVYVVVAAAASVVQEKKPEGKPQEQAVSDEMREEIAEYMKYSMPGEHHGHLKALAGKWHLAGTAHSTSSTSL